MRISFCEVDGCLPANDSERHIVMNRSSYNSRDAVTGMEYVFASLPRRLLAE